MVNLLRLEHLNEILVVAFVQMEIPPNILLILHAFLDSAAFSRRHPNRDYIMCINLELKLICNLSFQSLPTFNGEKSFTKMTSFFSAFMKSIRIVVLLQKNGRNIFVHGTEKKRGKVIK
jgi:hypothetical protein